MEFGLAALGETSLFKEPEELAGKEAAGRKSAFGIWPELTFQKPAVGVKTDASTLRLTSEKMDGTRFELVTPSMSTKCATTAPTVRCVVVPQGRERSK
jgi:hypothetical protein